MMYFLFFLMLPGKGIRMTSGASSVGKVHNNYNYYVFFIIVQDTDQFLKYFVIDLLTITAFLHSSGTFVNGNNTFSRKMVS